MSGGGQDELFTEARPDHAGRSANAPLLRRLEQFNGVSVRILQLNLPAARPDLHFVAELKAGLLQPLDTSRKVRHLENDAIPSAWLLMFAVR